MNSKELVRKIHELAKTAIPTIPGGGGGGGSGGGGGGGGGAPGGGGGGGVKDPAVKAMQQELVNLGQAVTAQIHLEGVGVGEDKRTQQEAWSRDSFGDFITKNYLRNSDVPGVEFDPNPTKQKMDQKKPADPTRLSVVMDTMKRIGNPKGGELTPDGAWGPRTNAALHNAYAFAFAMLNLAKDFNLPVRSYQESNLTTLKTEIPDDDKDITPEQKAGLAPRISKHLRAIQRVYKEIKDGILEKPAYKAFIESDKPFVTYKKKAPKLTQQQLDGLSQTFAQGFAIRSKDKSATIAVKDLVSMDALKKWQQQNLPEFPLQLIIAQLRQQVHPAEQTQ